MDNNSHDLEILEHLFQTRLNHSDLSWQLFCDKFRKMVIKTLTMEEIKEGNPQVYQAIVTKTLSSLVDIKLSQNRTKRENEISPNTIRVFKCRKEAKVGDSILYEGIQFVVVGLDGCQLIVNDINGNKGLVPNNLSKYQVVRKKK